MRNKIHRKYVEKGKVTTDGEAKKILSVSSSPVIIDRVFINE